MGRVHGDSLSFFGRRNIKMKAVALSSLIAVAFAEPEAEAKPYYYGAYGLGYGGYSGYYGHGLGYSGYYYGKREAEAEPKADADPYLLYGGYPYATYGHSVYYGKREAEADAEAKPYLYGAYGYGLGHYGYAGYPYAHHSVYYGKREAEAEAKPYYYGAYV